MAAPAVGDDDVLTAEEAAGLLRVSVATVLKETRAGRLPGVKVGREWRYSRVALLHHLRQYAGEDVAVDQGDDPEQAPSAGW